MLFHESGDRFMIWHALDFRFWWLWNSFYEIGLEMTTLSILHWKYPRCNKLALALNAQFTRLCL